MACFGACEQLGWPIDRVVTAEVWATDTIPADLPPMVEFKAHVNKIIKERWGIEAEHVCAMCGGKKRVYEDIFYSHRATSRNGNTIHKMYRWPFQKGAWCNDRLKVNALKEINQKATVYLGIAADESGRFHNLTDTKKSPLVEAGWTEADCRRWCEENDMLSPIYTTATRGGCWVCHNQGVGQLRLLRRNYPELWALMLKWDADSPVSFKADGHTVHDYDERFRLEDEGLIPENRSFRWSALDETRLTAEWYITHGGDSNARTGSL